MLELRGISHAFGARALLSRVSVALQPHDRLGIVGPNGSGKSTLLRIAAGELRPDEGVVAAQASLRVVYVPQRIDAPPRVTVRTRFPMRAAGPGVAALGLNEVNASTPIAPLSGGERVRLALAEAFAAHADVLLLDEPTNHLDLTGMRWLETRLASFQGAAVVVSHDGAFLDRVVRRLIVLDGDGGADEFIGGYSAWVEERARRTEAQRLAFGRQQRDERRLREHLSQIESRSRYIEQSTINFAIRKKAKKIARRSTTLKRRLEREAASVARVERPESAPAPFLGEAHPVGRSTSRLVDIERVEVAAGDRVLLRDASATVRPGDRIAMIGDNGAGKSTLLAMIRDRKEPAVGRMHIAQAARIGFLGQDEELEDALRLLPADLVRRGATASEGAVHQLLHRVLGATAANHATVGQLSYGERRRLALALLVARGANLLLLDEPTNHLDLPAREAMEGALAGFRGAMVFATHDRALIAALATAVWSIEGGRLVLRSVEEVVRP